MADLELYEKKELREISDSVWKITESKRGSLGVKHSESLRRYTKQDKDRAFHRAVLNRVLHLQRFEHADIEAIITGVSVEDLEKELARMFRFDVEQATAKLLKDNEPFKNAPVDKAREMVIEAMVRQRFGKVTGYPDRAGKDFDYVAERIRQCKTVKDVGILSKELLEGEDSLTLINPRGSGGGSRAVGDGLMPSQILLSAHSNVKKKTWYHRLDDRKEFYDLILSSYAPSEWAFLEDPGFHVLEKILGGALVPQPEVVLTINQVYDRVLDGMERCRLTIEKDVSDEDLVWKRVEDLVPNGSILEEQYRDYKRIRREVEDSFVKQMKKLNCKAEPFPEPVELPVEKYGEAAFVLHAIGGRVQEKSEQIETSRDKKKVDESILRDESTPSMQGEKNLLDLDFDAYLSAPDLARRFDVPFQALKKRLERFRKQSKEGWRDTWGENIGSREPKYLYQVARVFSIIQDLKRKASCKRPSK